MRYYWLTRGGLRDELVKRKTTIFLHVPKTGGTTFHGILRQVYGSGVKYCSTTDLEDIQRNAEQYECLVLHWHKDAFMHKNLMVPQAAEFLKEHDVFCMFRAPVPHSVSLFCDLQRRKDQILPIYERLGRALPATMKQYLETEPGNQQLACFLGRIQTGEQLVTKTELKLAQSLIHACGIHVGVLERFDAFLEKFEHITGHVARRDDVHILNRGNLGYVGILEEDMLKRISAHSPLDQLLYESALGTCCH